MTNREKIQWPVLFAAAIVSVARLSIAEPTSAPTVVDATDQAAITANLNKDVVVEGVVEKAAWSASGKVMIIEFKGVDSAKFGAAAFSGKENAGRTKLDAAFMGDAAKDFTGAKLRIRGKIIKYGGKAPAMMNALQIIISDPSAVTIVEPAAGAATTKPAM